MKSTTGSISLLAVSLLFSPSLGAAALPPSNLATHSKLAVELPWPFPLPWPKPDTGTDRGQIHCPTCTVQTPPTHSSGSFQPYTLLD